MVSLFGTMPLLRLLVGITDALVSLGRVLVYGSASLSHHSLIEGL